MDVISLVRVVHDHDDEAVLALLRNIRTVCMRGTVLLIAEPFSGNPATARVTDAYFSLYFAAWGRAEPARPQTLRNSPIKLALTAPGNGAPICR